MGNVTKQGKLAYSFAQMEQALDSFVTTINKQNIQYDCIFGIARGGLIPAIRLSHRLGVPLRTITWTTRDGDVRDHEDVATMVKMLEENKRVLLVEDIIDSGKTLTEMFKLIPVELCMNLDIAALINNVDFGLIPTYTSMSISRSTDNAWYEFWWESKGKNEIKYLQACW